jgi:hypothetical protein
MVIYSSLLLETLNGQHLFCRICACVQLEACDWRHRAKLIHGTARTIWAEPRAQQPAGGQVVQVRNGYRRPLPRRDRLACVASSRTDSVIIQVYKPLREELR